ncbi:MAG TPA: CAP domain-containing protein [Acidimicrobiia bacterium]|nr:CAP domain-containing protein [Acidimicrobiia bacterium]
MRRALTLLAAVAGWVAVIQIAAGSVAPVPEFQVQGLAASEVVVGLVDGNRLDKSTTSVERAVVTTTTTTTPPTTTSTVVDAPTTTAAPATTTTTRAPRTATTAAPAPAPTTTAATVTTAAPTTTTTAASSGNFSSSAESDFVSRINNLRASVGLRALRTDSGLHGYARNWSEEMATSGSFRHSDIGAYIKNTSWGTIGENIGKGGSVGGIFEALKKSQSHYDNMVNPGFTHIGVGVYVDANGTIWTTHVFGG